MDAINFLKEKTRMCDYYDSCDEGCPMDNIRPTGMRCEAFTTSEPEKAVAIVEQWSKEHPLKTRMQDFLEKFPNAMMNGDGTPPSCCKSLGYCEECTKNMTCTGCWNEPIEEKE